jgi:hypothetical protein
MHSQPAIYEQLKKAIREKYSSTPQNENELTLDTIRMFTADILKTNEIDHILQDAATIIYTIFGFKEVLIGLKNNNGLFRYRVILGHSKKAKEAIAEAEYRIEEMAHSEEFPGVVMSNLCEFNLKEDLPDNATEIRQFNRPAELSKERTSIDEMMEGDYLDVYIYGVDDKMLGWIEVSYPGDGRFPSREKVRGLELLASVIGLSLSYLGLPE